MIIFCVLFWKQGRHWHCRWNKYQHHFFRLSLRNTIIINNLIMPNQTPHDSKFVNKGLLCHRHNLLDVRRFHSVRLLSNTSRYISTDWIDCNILLMVLRYQENKLSNKQKESCYHNDRLYNTQGISYFMNGPKIRYAYTYLLVAFASYQKT